MKRNRFLLIIFVALAGTIIFWKREEIKKRFGISKASAGNSNTQTNNKTNGNSHPAPSPTSPASNTSSGGYRICNGYPLAKGCKGTKVRIVQHRLNKKHQAGLTEDGIFGPATEAALLQFGYGSTVEQSDINKLMGPF